MIFWFDQKDRNRSVWQTITSTLSAGGSIYIHFLTPWSNIIPVKHTINISQIKHNFVWINFILQQTDMKTLAVLKQTFFEIKLTDVSTRVTYHDMRYMQVYKFFFFDTNKYIMKWKVSCVFWHLLSNKAWCDNLWSTWIWCYLGRTHRLCTL